MSQRERMSQLNRTETDAEPLTVAVGKQWIIVDLSATVYCISSHDVFMFTIPNICILFDEFALMCCVAQSAAKPAAKLRLQKFWTLQLHQRLDL